MSASPRRVGAETSQKRDALLDCVEKLMLEQGYFSVTYRALAAEAGVTPSLVQYYFPSLDDIFLAAIRRYSDRNLAVLERALRKHAANPLRGVWEYSWDEASGSMMTEFMALGNHRKTIRSEIAEVADCFRKLQIEALVARFGADNRFDGDVSLGAAVLLINGIPKLLNLEKGVGIDTAHADVVHVVERYLDSLGKDTTPHKQRTPRRAKR